MTSRSSGAAGPHLPTPLKVAFLAALIEAAGFTVTGAVLLWGGFTNGPLPDVMGLGAFFVLLAGLVVVTALLMVRGSALGRGALITCQVLWGLSLTSFWTYLHPVITFGGMALVLAIIIGSVMPASRAYIGR